MTLTGVESIQELRGLARARSRDYVTKTIAPPLLEQTLSEGWQILQKNRRSIRVSMTKRHGDYFEDRVWMLLYRMGFLYLSGVGGASLKIDPKDPDSPKTQIDVVGIDEEVSIAIECKSSESYSRRPQFSEELGKLALIRARFATSVNQQFPEPVKRQSALAMFTSKIILSENDRKRATDAGITIFDEKDLEYYEGLVAHLGPAAKYQFLADLLPGKHIPGLTLRVPAIRTRMGGHNCYTFSVAPSYLLKMAFVSHRAKGKASDVNTYQRLIRKTRLRKLREYIDQDGVFPTNIVLNLDQKPTFDLAEQESDQHSGKMGWLTLRPAYKSAWVIDGQHRLYAYSGHERADKARLAVLAFEGLPPSKQAELFIDINAQQKSVKQSLLQELYAELNWNAAEPEARVQAIISKAIQTIDADVESPFYGRVLFADDARSHTRCISLGNLFKSLDHAEFYVSIPRKNGPPEYGPLWGGQESEQTRRRTVVALNGWFKVIRANSPDWWDAGSGEGGGLAMNDGVACCIAVLRSVYQHLESKGERLTRLDEHELVERVDQYANALGKYLGSLSLEERRRFRELRGVQGITTRTRRCQQAVQQEIPSFEPAGLQEWLDLEKAQTNQQAKTIVDRIEIRLQKTILEELRREFTADAEQWWYAGIPVEVRKPATSRLEDDGGKRPKEGYLDLIDYRPIITKNWSLLGDMLGYAPGGNGKEKRTAWLTEINEIRRIVSHASSGRSVTREQLAQLEVYDQWLESQISNDASQGDVVDADEQDE